MKILGVSFYTDDKYRELCERMAKSAELVGVEVHLYDYSRITEGENWGRILYWKPHVVLRAMREFPDKEAILWIDGDVTWREHPKLLHQIPETKWVACYVEQTKYLWGGFMWVRNCDGGREMMRAWIRENEAHPGGLDDHNAFWAFMRGGFRPRIYKLPITYCWTERIMRRRFPGAVPVLEHALIVTLGDKRLRATTTYDRPFAPTDEDLKHGDQ